MAQNDHLIISNPILHFSPLSQKYSSRYVMYRVASSAKSYLTEFRRGQVQFILATIASFKHLHLTEKTADEEFSSLCLLLKKKKKTKNKAKQKKQQTNNHKSLYT